MSSTSVARRGRETTAPRTRFERGCDVADEGRIVALGEGMYRVWGSRTTPYLVDFAGGICSCPDWQRNGRETGEPCKHQHSIALRIRRRQLRRRQPVAQLHKLAPGESLRGVLASPEVLERVAERVGVA